MRIFSSVSRRPLWMGMAVGMMVLSGCTQLFPNPPAPKKVIAGNANSYMSGLAMAQLAFDKQPDRLAPAQPYVTQMNAYMAGTATKNTKDSTMTVVTLTLKTADNHHTRAILVPTPSRDMHPMEKAMAALASRKPEFSAIGTHSVTIGPRPVIALRHATASDVNAKVTETVDAIRATAQPLLPLEDARLQLELSQFFLHAHVRDAAYLTLENAKNSLGSLSASTTEDEADIASLTHESEALENTLHKKLPYNF